MDIKVIPTAIPEVLLVEPQVFGDERGFFMEVYREDVFGAAGLPKRFVQLNHSGSVRNVLRGLHFQWEPPMGKLMRVTRGTAFLVAVDVRPGSPTVGRWVGAELSEDTKQQLWAPAGFARGFAVLSEYAEIQYLCTGTYNQSGEGGVAWDDSDIGVEWPVAQPTISARDRDAQSLAEWLASENASRLAYTNPLANY